MLTYLAAENPDLVELIDPSAPPSPEMQNAANEMERRYQGIILLALNARPEDERATTYANLMNSADTPACFRRMMEKTINQAVEECIAGLIQQERAW